MSGRYFFNTGRGAFLHGAWEDNIPAYPLMLRDSGYHIGKSYKVWGPGAPADAPFGRQQYAYQKGGAAPNNFSEEATKLIGQGQDFDTARAKILQAVRINFDDFLKARTPGQPWHYFFGPTNTHRTWVKGSGKKLWDINPDSLKGKMPKFLPDVPEVREDVADYLGEVQALDAYIGVLLDMLEKSGEANRTLIMLSGDHGMPGVPSGKCNLYDAGVQVPLIMRVPDGKPNRVVDDMVSLPDLAPTFMEIGGVKAPENLYGRSLLPLLQSEKSGQIDPTRNWVITGRERHVQNAREESLPYPQRALRTPQWVYVHNFESDRWPMGSPGGTGAAPDGNVEINTMVTFADMDAGPTKAWLVKHKNDPQGKWYYDWAFGKRPREELYDVQNDPNQIRNLAADPQYAAQKNWLFQRLMKLLKEAGDPRIIGDGKTFERPPFVEKTPLK
jgi:arylsulfatase A-like enzyme